MAPSSPQIQDIEYLYASNASFSQFVSVKLSGNHNYHLWKTQMICLMESHDMCGIVDDALELPGASSIKIVKQYDSLLKGWIFGSISEDVFGNVVDLSSAKDVWDTLKSLYDLRSVKEVQPTMSSQQEEMATESEHVITGDIEAGKDTISQEAETKTEEEKTTMTEKLHEATWEGSWRKVKKILEKEKDAVKEAIDNELYTILHIACITGYNDFLKKLLLFIKKKDVKEILEKQTVDGYTALHFAASAGNKYAMKLLIEKDNDLLTIPDKKNELPLTKALNNMQFDSFAYLLTAAVDNGKEQVIFQGPDHEIQTEDRLLVNAITAKQYSTALVLARKFPKSTVANDEVLMAIARTFPSELNYWETLIYPPSLEDRVERGAYLLYLAIHVRQPWQESKWFMGDHAHLALIVPVFIIFWVWGLIRFLTWMVFFPLRLPYLLLWKVVARLVPPIKHIEKKIKVLEEAQEVLNLICDQIDKLKLPAPGTHHPFYDGPIVEAAIQNADRVFVNIFRSCQTIESKDKNGYDIFQLAVIHRSEKIYNLLYIIGEDKNRYRTIKDSSQNNMLHLAGRLAPSHVLKRRTGAALQLQRELQWFEELKTFMHPSAITKRNIFGETPGQVFTREHENLVKEGEKWMKITAESCSISAALITTIVFAAAITVPGGSNQETGIPMFRKDIAFTIFAISDAISLFTSTSSLMVFLSILTARFSEEDFLVSLPKRLIIGLCTLLLSITAMMVAFGTTLYLVFSQEKQWMLGPICGFACLPILFFVTLQFPLIADLYRSTYVPIFDK